MPKATINDPMNPRGICHFSSFSTIVYWRERNLLQNVEDQKNRSLHCMALRSLKYHTLSFKSREIISLLPSQNYTLLQNNRHLKRYLSDINILFKYMENILTL